MTIIAITDDRRIVLVEQFRIPLGCSTIELPAGLTGDVPEDQTPGADALAASARRELIEETGYEAAAMRFPWITTPTSSGLTSEMVTFFCVQQACGASKCGWRRRARANHRPRAARRRVDSSRIAARQAEGRAIDPKIFAGLHLIRNGLGQREIAGK